MTTPVPIRSQPGVQRDGTRFDSLAYIDAQWCRFQRGLPRKIRGYQMVNDTLLENVYGMHSFSANGLQYLHMGSATELRQITVQGGISQTNNDRAPDGLAESPFNVWQFDAIYDSNAEEIVLVAHAAPNLQNIDSSTQTSIWYGGITGTGALSATGLDDTSGGIVVVGNYLVSLGSEGRVQWTPANDVSSVEGELFVTPQKLVRGFRYRGGGIPAALLWSLDSLLLMRLNTTGENITWNFDTLTDEISVLSSRGIIEYNGVFYWPGVDSWKMFNGVVQDLPNPFNTDWFFDGLNYTHRQKVFAFKVPRFGEIWWCYPRGSATECTHAVIYNVREQIWYDTELPDLRRTDGIYAKVYNRPFMVSLQNPGAGRVLYQHETGVDHIYASQVNPIPSWFETGEISLLRQGQDSTTHVARIEPDFVQSGEMQLSVRGRNNSRSPTVSSQIYSFPAVASEGSQETIPLKETRRLMSFKFESNVQGGNYQMGNTLAHLDPAGKRVQT